MGLLNYLDDVYEAFVDVSRKAVYKRINQPIDLSLEKYFPSEIHRVIDRLEKRGFISIEETADGIKMTITEKGRSEAFRINIDHLEKKHHTWDGKWRIVMFDIEETTRSRRDKLRKYLEKLGFRQYQKSVFICPYDCELEINYLKGILKSTGEIKYGIVERFDDDIDLKKEFGL